LSLALQGALRGLRVSGFKQSVNGAAPHSGHGPCMMHDAYDVGHLPLGSVLPTTSRYAGLGMI